MGMIVSGLLRDHKWLQAKPCVQVYTFGQHNHHDLGNNHRPLLRLKRNDAPLYPDAIRVPSWRQLNGDKRADPRGRVPGDVFDKLTQNINNPTVPANDFLGRLIEVGHAVVYPVRRGSKMWMQKASVTEIRQHDRTQPPLLVCLNPMGRKVTRPFMASNSARRSTAARSS